MDAEARWLDLVRGLEDRLPALADRYVARVAAVDGYSSGVVDAEDLRVTAVEVFGVLIAALPRGVATDGDLERARRLGHTRARQGVPVASLVTAVRLDFDLLWGELVTLAGPDDAELLVQRVARVWSVVDEFASQTHEGYHEERTRMAREESAVRQSFVAQLFSPQGHLTEVQDRVALALDLPRQGTYGVVAAAPHSGKLLAGIADDLPGHFFLHQLGTATVGFWVMAEPGPRGVARLRRDPGPRLRTVACGLVQGVEGLGRVPQAAVTAAALSEVADPGAPRPVTLADGWTVIARRQLLNAGIDPAEPVERALAACRDGERERLVETVVSYLRTGDPARTAEELYCHRNTVLNRLRRFRELTGVDLEVPAETARLVLMWT